MSRQRSELSASWIQVRIIAGIVTSVHRCSYEALRNTGAWFWCWQDGHNRRSLVRSNARNTVYSKCHSLWKLVLNRLLRAVKRCAVQTAVARRWLQDRITLNGQDDETFRVHYTALTFGILRGRRCSEWMNICEVSKVFSNFSWYNFDFSYTRVV